MTNVWCGILSHLKVIALVHELFDTPSYVAKPKALYCAAVLRLCFRICKIKFSYDAAHMWNMERIGHTASEEMSFENVEDGRLTDRRTTEGRQMPTYTISSPIGSGEIEYFTNL